ncbi:protein BNIP5 isoform X2 [Bos javanicus]|uniref:protein BNIP5 isoform X2 n=1 Tax=Bos javanicus TaxID=9906 RepID=UPI002AA819A3|nr:protein BNIP5 isoform X2 [Bos javanicus]
MILSLDDWSSSAMEPPWSPRKPLSWRRAKSLDRLQNAQKDSESWDCQGPSLPTGPFRGGLCRTASDGARCLKSPVQSVEAQDTTAAAPSPEETKDLLSEQRPLQDAKKDKAQWQAPQGWLRFVVNLFFRTGPEEPKEKTNKKAKGKEGPSEPTETPESLGEPAPRKKAHSKKASRKKHSQRKRSAEEARGARDQEAEGQEAKAAEASRSEGADLGPAAREDIIIQKIVELLQKVGDQWEDEQHQALQSVVTPRNPAPVVKKKSQEKMSSLKRAFSFKKYGSEEPKRAGAARVSSAESRQPKRPNFLPLCVGGHRPSSSSLPGVEEPEVQEAVTTDGRDPSPFELCTPAESGGPDEDLQQDRATEFKEFIQKIIALLQDAEEQCRDKQLQVQEPEVAVENLAPAYRKKCQERKSNFRKAFYKKHSSKDPKRAGAAGAASPDSRPPKKPSFLPLCVGGHWPSVSSDSDPEDLEFQGSPPTEGEPVGAPEAPSQARSHKPEAGRQPDGANESKELIIQELVALLQEVDGQLGKQIKRHPSFKKFLYEPSVSSLRKLVATLRSRGAHTTEPKRTYPFVFGLGNQGAGNNYHTVLSLTGLHYRRPSYGQFPYEEAQQNITSSQIQSPD